MSRRSCHSTRPFRNDFLASAAIDDANPVPVHYLPAHPAGEQKGPHGDERQHNAPRQYCGIGTLGITQREITNCEYDCAEIPDHVKPSRIEAADALFAKEVSEPGERSHKRHHDTRSDEPDRCFTPQPVPS